MTLVVNPGPTTSAAGPNQSVCTSATLGANTPAVGTGSWTVVSGAGVFSNPSSPFSTYTPSSQNVANTIRWTISSPGCTSSTDDVVITATCIPTTTVQITPGTTSTGLTGCPSTIVFTDDGGTTGNYTANFSGIKTFNAPAGSCLTYSFSNFYLESCCDDFNIYDGATTGSPLIGNYTGSTIPPSGKSTGNSLTFQFTSDGSVQYEGWILYVSCANACSGTPNGGIAVATPSVRCSNYTTTLTVSGGSSSDCGITYQWQDSNNGTSGWGPIAGATAQTMTASITATRYYRCVITCPAGGLTGTSSVATASMQGGGCGCPVSITLPYTASGQTTCGQGNDLTSSNVTNVCGSTSYYTGEDVVYTFTPSTTGQITIDLTSSGSYTGLMLYKGCPTSGGTCISNSQDYNGNKSACATVTAGIAYYLVIDSYASPTCNPYNIVISAPTGTTVACNMAYTASSTTYSFENFSGTVLPTTDDVLFNASVNFGFQVCFDGKPYTGGYVASNAALVFDAVQCFPNINSNTIASGGVSTGYTIPNPAPVNGTSIPRNAILAPWHDIHPGLGGTIQYATLGTAPNRRFIVSYENVPMFSCGTASTSIYFSSQIKVFETTNTIEIHVKKKGVCPGWNNGQAVLGLQNYNGTTYIPAVNNTVHNAVASPGPYNQWTMTNTAYKFTTTCGSAGPCAVVLPITFKTFYGERVQKVNHLYWETASEENLKMYKVEHSLDGVNFMPIGEVLPKNTASKYHFEDHNAALGVVNYYRIKILEYDNTYSYTNIYPLSSDKDEILTVSQIFPNPTNTSFTLGLESKQKGEATINLYDMYGKLVKSSNHGISGGVNQFTIDISHLSYGVYYVEVLNSFNEIITKQKLIKE